MASRSAVVILGGRNPDVVDLNSKIEEALGVIGELLIPTCENEVEKSKESIQVIIK